MTWINGKTPPTKSGYYLTLYFNQEFNDRLLKAFWYSAETEKWKCNPRWQFVPKIEWWWNTRHDFYMPCQLQENLDKIPEEKIDYLNITKQIIGR